MSTSEVGRAGFGGSSRQNSGISLFFCLLQGPHGVFLEVAVDKIKAFRSFFVYFRDRAISSHQRTAFHKKGSSNHCIKEKGDHPLRSTFYPVRRSHSKGPAVRFLSLQAGCIAQKQDFSRRSPVNHLFFIGILAPEAEDESGNDRTDDNGKNVAERVVCKRRYPEAAVRCRNGYVPQADESS